ncbi:hypothetical protein Nmel_001250 [Mimus melanotis]
MALPPPGHPDRAGGRLGRAWVTKGLGRQEARTGREAGAPQVSLSAPEDRGVAARRLQIGRSRLSRPRPAPPILSCPVPCRAGRRAEPCCTGDTMNTTDLLTGRRFFLLLMETVSHPSTSKLRKPSMIPPSVL